MTTLRFSCKSAILNIFLYEFSFRCVVSGCGKIALHVLEKLIAYGALPVTVSGMFLTIICRTS